MTLFNFSKEIEMKQKPAPGIKNEEIILQEGDEGFAKEKRPNGSVKIREIVRKGKIMCKVFALPNPNLDKNGLRFMRLEYYTENGKLEYIDHHETNNDHLEYYPPNTTINSLLGDRIVLYPNGEIEFFLSNSLCKKIDSDGRVEYKRKQHKGATKEEIEAIEMTIHDIFKKVADRVMGERNSSR